MDSCKNVSVAIQQATDYLLSVQRPGDYYWCGEVESNSTMTSEYVMVCQILGLEVQDSKIQKIIKYYRDRQNPADGSWSIAHEADGDISTTTEAYLALTILGMDAEDPVLCKAKSFILSKGGLANVRMFTRINLALFGIFSWDAVPVLPAELILLPPKSPVNVYYFSSWARATIVPLLVINNHRPVYKLPKSKCYSMMDELWSSGINRSVPYVPPLRRVVLKNGASWKSLVSVMELVLKAYEKVKIKSLRKYALAKCMRFITDRQEPQGDIGGIFPATANGVIAMTLEGFSVQSKEVIKAVEALERFSWETNGQYRLQSCSSPVWDTSLATIALLDCGYDPKDIQIEGAIRWMLDRQCLVQHGDWKVYRPKLEAGGWSFEYFNTWYPDVDDSAVVLISLFKQDPNSIHRSNVQKGLKWVVGMQNKDGGWGAFDVENDKHFLNEIPFSDMDALSDPSCPDLAGHILEMLGIYLQISEEYAQTEPHQTLRREVMSSVSRGVKYLQVSQEFQGSWFGRWGVNYLYGTSGCLCGLGSIGFPKSDLMVCRAIEWLKGCQNDDGGWGEGFASYGDKSMMGKGTGSTASQTAWAVIGLLAYLSSDDVSIKRGVMWLLQNLSPLTKTGEAYEGGLKLPVNCSVGMTWTEDQFTGTGFPDHVYLRYELYRHYFPMMALGRYAQSFSASGEAEQRHYHINVNRSVKSKYKQSMIGFVTRGLR
ncbi:hypothetical protein R1sor_012053 [Riccia sorocarpa]|uniref:Terpene cyclase/mutase family member n=1 Tax=Riccia sorocarpa TaxID=122646 RepID=A0ABD3I6M3_9MARC